MKKNVLNSTRKLSRALAIFVSLALTLTLLPALTPQAHAVTWYDDLTTAGFTCTDNGSNKVTVTGGTQAAPKAIAATIHLAIPAGYTLDWKAYASGAGLASMFNLTGAGTFDMTDGLINVVNASTNTSVDAVISISLGAKAKISGGVIAAEYISAIHNWGTLEVTGGFIAINDGDSGEHPAIYGDGDVVMSGGDVLYGAETTSYAAVYIEAGGSLTVSNAACIASLADLLPAGQTAKLTSVNWETGATISISGGIILNFANFSSTSFASAYPTISAKMLDTFTPTSTAIFILADSSADKYVNGSNGGLLTWRKSDAAATPSYLATWIAIDGLGAVSNSVNDNIVLVGIPVTSSSTTRTKTDAPITSGTNEGGVVIASASGATTLPVSGSSISYTMNDAKICAIAPTQAEFKKIVNSATGNFVEMKFSLPADALGITLELDTAWLDFADKGLTIDLGPLGKITLSAATVAELKALGGKITIEIKKGSLIFDVKKDGKSLELYNVKNPIVISVPAVNGQTMFDGVARSWLADGTIFGKVYATGTYEPGTGAEAAFSDVTGGWMEQAVGFMAARGIVNGVGDGKYNPGGTVTRAQFVTMLMRMLNVEMTGNWMPAAPSDAADIPEWAMQSVLKAKAMGMLEEIAADGNFRPNEPITREDMFTITYKAMVAVNMIAAPIEPTAEEPATDAKTAEAEAAAKAAADAAVAAAADATDAEAAEATAEAAKDNPENISDYAVLPMAILVENKLVQGSNGLLNPLGSSTRAEAAQFLFNVLQFDAK